MEKLQTVTQEIVENMDMCFDNCHRWSFLRILMQMIKMIFVSYMGPCLSPIKYSTILKGRESGQNWCFSLSHISLRLLLILSKKICSINP